MTLTECLVAAVLIGIASVMLMMGINAMMGLIHQSRLTKENQSFLNEAVATGARSDEVFIEAGALDTWRLENLTISGQYYTYQTQDGQHFTIFTADPEG